MGGQQSVADLTLIEDVLRAQWLHLRSWVTQLDDATRRSPSGVGEWSVNDLLAHMSRAMDALAQAQPAPAGTVPLTLAEYLGAYPGRTQDVADVTGVLIVERPPAPFAAVDASAEKAFAQLTVLRGLAPDPVVQARRGPLLLSDMLLSRLTELVVHGDDLERSTTIVGPGPLDDAAVRLVSDALLGVAVDRGGWTLEVASPLAWIRLAAGRVPFSVDALAEALQPVYTSDSLPDLGAVLPLL